MKTALVLAAALLAPLAALAQSTEPMKTKALSFNINGLTLSGLNGGLGGKIWLAGNRALTGSLGGSYSGSVTEAGDSIYVDDKYKSWSVVVNVGIEQHFDWQPGLSPYLTGGVFLGQSGTRNTTGLIADPSVSRDRNILMGGKAGFGLEYWVTPRISVSGQQLVTATYSFGKYDPPGPFDQETRRLGFDLGTSSVILSVYL